MRVASVCALAAMVVGSCMSVAAQDRRPRRPASPETRASRLAFSRDLIGRQNTRLTLSGERIRVDFTSAAVTSDDYDRFESLGDGDVATFTRGAVIKLRTAISLAFGDVIIATDNVAPDYPGVYGVWLRKSGDGWELALTNEPDVWGTQFDREAEVAVIPLSSAETDDPTERFLVELTASGETGGRLDLHWGPHHWFVPFSVQ
jgi:hypothetical protein